VIILFSFILLPLYDTVVIQWRIQDFEKGGSHYSVHEEWKNFLLDHAHF